MKYGGGAVIVRTSLRDAHARIEVEDGGPGIPAGDRERIWKPFVRLRRADGVPGSGIGLAVVRQLVAAHEGRTSAEDVPYGGTRFIVELPGAWSRTSSRPACGPGYGGFLARVLIVEDNRNLAHGLRTNLEYEGHTVEIAEDGATGLALGRERRHQLIVLDLMLPSLDGFRCPRGAARGWGGYPCSRADRAGRRGRQGARAPDGADDYVDQAICIEGTAREVEALLRAPVPLAAAGAGGVSDRGRG